MTKLQWQADVGAILNLLSQHLYPRRLAYLRELVSNAVDATLLGPTAESPIDVTLGDGHLMVEDRGRGLRPEDVGSLIGRIGMSGTTALRTEIDDGPSFLGAFGVGLLAVRVAAECVEIRSKHREATSGIHMTWDGGPTFEWQPDATRTDPGTSVALRLTPSEAAGLTHACLADFLRRHLPHVPVPIRLHGRWVAGHLVPWRTSGLDLLAWCRTAGMQGVIEAAMVTDPRGSAILVGIPDIETRDGEGHRVYRSGVLVPGLGAAEVPVAFRWLESIADLPWLSVTLDRELPTEPGRIEAMQTLEVSLGRALVVALRRLGTHPPPEAWWARHRDSLMKSLAKLLDAGVPDIDWAGLAEWLLFRTNGGAKPLASLDHREPLAFVRDVQGDARWIEAGPQGRPVVLVEGTEEERILIALARATHIPLEQWLRGAWEVTKGPGARYSPEVLALVRMLDQRMSVQGIRVRIDATFEGPHGIASWLHRPGWLAVPRTSTYDPEWLRPESTVDADQPTLGLNPWSPVIQGLARAIDPSRAGAVGSLLVEIAGLAVLGPNLHRVQLLKRRIVEALCAIAEIVPPPLTKPRFFVAYDWKRDHAAFEAVRDVMTSPPFEWELVHPLEQQSGRYILENVRAALGAAHVIVSVLSTDDGPWRGNPNILLEAGMAEGMGGRVHIVCQRKGTSAITDIQGLLRIEYEGASDLRVELRRVLDAMGLTGLAPTPAPRGDA